MCRYAEVSELADEQDSGSCERYAREGSSPFFRMIKALADARAFLRTDASVTRWEVPMRDHIL